MEWALVAGGALVGFIVGLTGVGGGSLMTPLLIYGFGVSPHLAVGTDLLFAAITKSGGALSFAKHRMVPWRIVVPLTVGGLAGVGVMLVFLKTVGPASEHVHRLMQHTLGVMLLLTAAATLYKVVKSGGVVTPSPSAALDNRATPAAAHGRVNSGSAAHTVRDREQPRWAAGPWLMGAVIGALVTLTSVGAGAVGMAILMVLYPHVPLPRLVAADVTYAVPLTLAAGLGHAALGTVDWAMLGWLLLGSLPGIWVGSHLVRVVPQRWVRSVLSLLLGGIGAKLLLA
ncbi:sulfite exporter TauE/SafE family protein [Hydrogenophilus thermoluteolus]|uniref:Probable membrane transporter protein n=1 Tax=Hydrogenophilus thermoluteolus TaxID=297 RepID=A0A2Z6DV70_HYDTE|nr:sulfite exporter TauE/SafE family protein [Hydrogenophilus thermoluteolus]BBD76336.1 hypothetical protein HPTL_0066 [Hydrogenophilus thermoluteolus]GLW60549.1 UPF0721 transmembrane protein [Hydrogenophilus thermoluteolus]